MPDSIPPRARIKPISLDDYLMRRDVKFGIQPNFALSAIATVKTLNALQDCYGKELTITSGYRPPQLNETIPHAAKGDAHERCLGVDLHDPDKAVSKWCLEHIEILVGLGLWMESPEDAHDHVHLQCIAPRSGNRVFRA